MGPYRRRTGRAWVHTAAGPAEHGSISPPGRPSMGPYRRRTGRAWVHIAAGPAEHGSISPPGRPSMGPYRRRTGRAWVHIAAGRAEHGSIPPPDEPSMGPYRRRTGRAWVHIAAGRAEHGSISRCERPNQPPSIRGAAGRAPLNPPVGQERLHLISGGPGAFFEDPFDALEHRRAARALNAVEEAAARDRCRILAGERGTKPAPPVTAKRAAPLARRRRHRGRERRTPDPAAADRDLDPAAGRAERREPVRRAPRGGARGARGTGCAWWSSAAGGSPLPGLPRRSCYRTSCCTGSSSPATGRAPGASPRRPRILALVHHLQSDEPERGAAERGRLREEEGAPTSAAWTACSPPAWRPPGAALRLAGREMPTAVAPPGRDRLAGEPFPAPPARPGRDPGARAAGPLRAAFLANLIPRKRLLELLDAVAAVPRLDARGRRPGRHGPRLRRRSPAPRRRARSRGPGSASSAALDRERLEALLRRSCLLAVPSTHEGVRHRLSRGLRLRPAGPRRRFRRSPRDRHRRRHRLADPRRGPPARTAERIADRLRLLATDRGRLAAMGLRAAERRRRHPTWAESAAPPRKQLFRG